MSPDETHQTSKSAKDNNINSQQGSGGRKTSSSTSSSTKPQEQNIRYWTKGGALRNVPIGGGCRKNKRVKSSSRLSCDSKDSATSSSEFVGGFKFLHSLSSPSMDFHLGNGLPFPRLQQQPRIPSSQPQQQPRYATSAQIR
ncbi:hypothetical protein RYX36_007113 [Vicia faba]